MEKTRMNKMRTTIVSAKRSAAAPESQLDLSRGESANDVKFRL